MATERNGRAAAAAKHGERGAIAIMIAVAIVVMFSFAVLGLDMAIVMTTKTQLQNAADAAALAGASGLATGSQAEARDRAIGIAGNNRAVRTTQQPVVLATRRSLVLAPEWGCSQAHFVAGDDARQMPR